MSSTDRSYTDRCSSPFCHLNRQVVNVHLECLIARLKLIDFFLYRVNSVDQGCNGMENVSIKEIENMIERTAKIFLRSCNIPIKIKTIVEHHCGRQRAYLSNSSFLKASLTRSLAGGDTMPHGGGSSRVNPEKDIQVRC